MKIAVTSSGPTLDDMVEARFGRCPYFLLIEPDIVGFEAVQNPNISLGGGAGPQSAQLMASKGVSVILTGNCGPNAFQTFGAAGIQVITGVSGRVREAVEQFRAEALTHSSAPSVQSHFGMGRGMGSGRGMGRGMGTSRGTGGGFRRSMGMKAGAEDTVFASINPSQPSHPSGEEEIESLKQEANNLRNQLEAIETKIRDLDKR